MLIPIPYTRVPIKVWVGLLLFGAVILTILLRVNGAGEYLTALDPYWHMRNVAYIMENGLAAYYAWNDPLSWWPEGRNASETSQVFMYLVAAGLYYPVSGFVSLTQFLIYFPVGAGALSVPVVFLLARRLAPANHDLAGLVAVWAFALMPDILVRGGAGWFRGEPLGLLFILVGIYLLVRGIQDKKSWLAVAGGICAACAMSAAPASILFVAPIAVYTITVVLRGNHWGGLGAVYLASMLLGTLMWERQAYIWAGHVGLGIEAGIAVIAVTAYFVKRGIRGRQLAYRFVLTCGIAIGAAYMLRDVVSPLYGRYYEAIGGHTSPLGISVSEHMVYANPVLTILTGVSMLAVLIACIRSDWIRGYLIVPLWATFVMFGAILYHLMMRLWMFADVMLALSAGIAVGIMKPERRILGVIVALAILMPMFYLVDNFGFTVHTPTIMHGAIGFETGDWIHALEWIRTETPADSRILSWWDYGYWIGTMGERATFSDGATMDKYRIADIARLLTDEPQAGIEQARALGATHLLVFVGAEKIGATPNNEALFAIRGGADESKAWHVLNIAGRDPAEYSLPDGSSVGKAWFEETLIGSMLPYRFDVYVDPNTLQVHGEYVPGLVPAFVKEYQEIDGIKLVYESPSSVNMETYQTVILVYEIMK